MDEDGDFWLVFIHASNGDLEDGFFCLGDKEAFIYPFFLQFRKVFASDRRL